MVKSILVFFSIYWYVSLIKVRRRWKIFWKKLNYVEIWYVLYFCVLMKIIVMVKILSGIIMFYYVLKFIFSVFLYDWKKNKYYFGYFLKIYFELKFKFINFIWLRLIYFSSRIKVKFCCCILFLVVINFLCIFLLIFFSLFIWWCVIGKS